MRKWTEIAEDLAKELDTSQVNTREVGGTTIPYLEGEYVIRRANEIFGPDGWSGGPTGPVQQFPLSGKHVLYSVPYQVEFHGLDENGNVHSIYHGDIGKNVARSDNSNNHEMSISGCATDALKRAMRHLGDQFGLALYDKESETFLRATGQITEPTITPEKLMERARNYEVPSKLPMEEGVETQPPFAGETLGDVAEDAAGRDFLGWLAGEMESPTGAEPFSPANEAQEKLQRAAGYIFENMEE